MQWSVIDEYKDIHRSPSCLCHRACGGPDAVLHTVCGPTSDSCRKARVGDGGKEGAVEEGVECISKGGGRKREGARTKVVALILTGGGRDMAGSGRRGALLGYEDGAREGRGGHGGVEGGQVRGGRNRIQRRSSEEVRER